VKKLKSIYKLLRIYQWTKSGFIFLPFIFSSILFEMASDPFGSVSIHAALKLIASFFGFSFLASAVYVMNDLKDIALDRLDPKKKHRPFASGALNPVTGYILIALLVCSAALLSLYLPLTVSYIFIIYFLQNIFYTYIGKRIILVDVTLIAAGYVLRVLVGAYALSIDASPWLLSSTFFISLFLGFFKRFYEVRVSPPEMLFGGAYTADTLRHFTNITASLSIITYSIYTIQGTHSSAHLYWTIPLVVLGIFRYYVLLQSPEELEEGNPSDVLLADKFLILTILFWMALCAGLILYYH